MSNSAWWFHCNKCRSSGSNGHGFWFTNCGHLICSNCHNKLVDNSPNSAATVGGKANCIVCQKLTTTIPINRATRSDVLVLFRPPKDVLTEYSPKFIKTLDFQQKQYQYVMKHFNEKSAKVVKYVRNAQIELDKQAEREQLLQVEVDQLKMDMAKTKEYSNRLENLVSDRDKQIERLKRSPYKSPFKSPHSPHRSRSRGTPKSPFKSPHKSRGTPSLHERKQDAYIRRGEATPLHELSYFGSATSGSTPFQQLVGHTTKINPTPGAGPFDLFGTPQATQRGKIPRMALDQSFALNTSTSAFGLNQQEQHGAHGSRKYF